MHKSTVLVADDEENVRRLVSSMLAKYYTILEASDGEEAVDMTRSQKPNLVLMDIMMPNVDGYTAASMLKTDEATKHIPIVMLTAVGQELNKKLAQTMGANGYITKPFTQQDLLHTIGRLMKNAK